MEAVSGFSVVKRNIGHWDVIVDKSRVFRVRGAPGQYIVIDERPGNRDKEPSPFKTVSGCMTFICDELMFELIRTQSQEPQVIEDWNLG